MSKDAFFQNIPYTKEPYEEILVSADIQNNQYKIAVQLRVLLIASKTLYSGSNDQVFERVMHFPFRFQFDQARAARAAIRRLKCC